MSDMETVVPLEGGNRMFEQVRVYWYDHDCEWISKYCEENHQKSTFVPRWTLERGHERRSIRPNGENA